MRLDSPFSSTVVPNYTRLMMYGGRYLLGYPINQMFLILYKSTISKHKNIRPHVSWEAILSKASLYSEGPTQNPYSTGFPVEYTYIPQEVRWNMGFEKINNQRSTRAFHSCT